MTKMSQEMSDFIYSLTPKEAQFALETPHVEDTEKMFAMFNEQVLENLKEVANNEKEQQHLGDLIDQLDTESKKTELMTKNTMAEETELFKQ